MGGVVRGEPKQFILFNLQWGSPADPFEQIAREFESPPDGSVRVGLAVIFSYLHQPREPLIRGLQKFLHRAQETGVPVLVQLDGENWWGARPDLWNWWDPKRPGYSPNNRENVEWTGWSPDEAIRIAWRNWGRQIRVLPPPNLMSPPYRAACHKEMAALVPVVLAWWNALPTEKKHLLVGLKLGWESSIGVNAWHYPEGNALLEQSASEDPVFRLKAQELPSRGMAQIGYAAVKTSGIRSAGQITEADLAETVRRHLDDLCRQAAKLGVPRDRLFTHSGGWKEGELLYQTAVNEFSCPGWSFYKHAADPANDSGVQAALKRSDAPWWAATEWLYQGPRQVESWRKALEATLTIPRCRYLCIYNWEGVKDSQEALAAVRQVVSSSDQRSAKSAQSQLMTVAPWPDISTVEPDLIVPPLTEGPPSAGRRVKETLNAWRETQVYHVIYLPADWQPGRQYPVLIEYAGNGGYTNQFGDISTGRPENSKLGYGLAGGKGFVWVCLPYLNAAGDALALKWWGDAPSHDPRPTLDYARQAVAWVCRQYGGDTGRVILSGFSRGAIACNFLGLHDDDTAGLWRAFVAFSHYDGVRSWPYPGADRASALLRLQRLGGRPQFICAEGNAVEETRRYLNVHAPEGNFQFMSTGFRNHNDAWILRPSESRTGAGQNSSQQAIRAFFCGHYM